MLFLNEIQFSYLNTPVLKNISLSLKEGEIGALIGSSGSGKTTLFKLLTGLVPLQGGEFRIMNETYLGHQNKIAYMTEQDLLLPWRTIYSNLMLLLELGKKPPFSKNLQLEAKTLLAEMGLENCASAYPHELSAGMRQRVSLARALLQKRPILLLDEPFSSLDAALKEQMYGYLREIKKKQGTTILLITHDFRDALSLGDHIFFLSDGIIKKTWSVKDSERGHPEKEHLLLNEMRSAILNI